MEDQYLNLVRNILESGSNVPDRTGVGTLQLFSQHLSFDLSSDQSTDTHIACMIPLLTTKSMATKTLIEEILWMLSGSTDSSHLNIWKHNTSREALDSLGLTHYPIGEIGPTYGHNFRKFGANTITTKSGTFEVGLLSSRSKVNPETFMRINPGVDQVAWVRDEIKRNPHSRRLMINLWDPTTLEDCALPPCVYGYQFCVMDGKLNLLVNQRSADVALGLPFNIAQSTIFLAMMAQETGYEVGSLTYSIGCAHIYNNHIEVIREQLNRAPYTPPTLLVTRKDFFSIKSSDIQVTGYTSHPKLQFPIN
jgi:thymidylate synthase